jgi:hypothetical protein
MTRLTYIVAGAALLTFIAAPASGKKDRQHHSVYSHGQHYSGHGKWRGDRYRGHRSWRGDRGYRGYRYRHYYAPGFGNYGYSYGVPYYGRSFYYPGYSNFYGYYPGYSNYYGYDRRYRRHHRRYRGYCDDGAAGAVIGGVAGALIGREIDRSGRRHYRYRRDGTTGLIVGGALGAVVGHEIARDC